MRHVPAALQLAMFGRMAMAAFFGFLIGFEREIAALGDLYVILALGGLAWEGILLALRALGHRPAAKPRFGHGAETTVGPYALLGCFHPSQQNTFTGKLTPQMADDVMRRCRDLAARPRPSSDPGSS